MKQYILILSLCFGLLAGCVQKVPQTADCTTIETFEKEASEYLRIPRNSAT
jgi:hypothetical protein